MFLQKFESVETVEVKIQNTQSQNIYFGAQEKLQNKIITRIVVNSDQSIKTPLGRTNASTNLLNNSVLVLVSKNREIINRVPLLQLGYTAISGYIFDINQVIDWDKSFIQVYNTTYLVTTQSFLFTVYISPKALTKSVINFNPAQYKVDFNEAYIDAQSKEKFFFLNKENLKGKKINSIFMFSVVKTPSGYTYAATTDISNSYLVLESKNRVFVNNLPLNFLDTQYNTLENKFIIDSEIDFYKSYILCKNLTKTASRAFLLYFIYEK